MGPSTLFDKSFLEMLNVDEAALFDVLFSAVISPLFYVEVLADLEKDDPRTRTREKVVSDIARKTPVAHSYPNVSHLSLCLNELLGDRIPMRGAPAIQGAVPVRHHGQVALVFRQSPESKAFARWQRQQFHDVERSFAAVWRSSLNSLDNAALADLTGTAFRIDESPKNLKHAFEIAKAVIERNDQNFLNLKLGYQSLGLDPSMWRAVVKRWKFTGHRPIPEYAPYFTYCLLVDLFFNIAMTKKMISPDRSSNRVDMGYLYYLPFAKLFVSNDNLHKRVTPFFLRDDQQLVNGAELKNDLAALDQHYSSLPKEELEKGLFIVASQPPDDEQYLTTRLWKAYGRLRTSAEKPTLRTNQKNELVGRIRQLIAQSKRPAGGTFERKDLMDPEHQMLERLLPRQWGKWTFLSVNEDDKPG